MNRRRTTFLLAVLALAGVIAVAARIPEIRRARVFAPAFFGLDRATERLFVDPGMSQGERESVIAAMGVAGKRVASFWGGRISAPIVCACSTSQCYHRFGGGRDRGQTTFGRILLSPRGLDAIIISHEWTHAELSLRTGRLFSRVPAWFSEGLAVVASEDPRYSEQVWQRDANEARPALRIVELDTLRQFLDAPGGYLAAGHEVRRWLAKVGPTGLMALVDALKAGEEFRGAYERIEQGSVK